MKIKQSEKGLYEEGFDDDLPPERLERILTGFAAPEAIVELLLEQRNLDSVTDMKRGELYPEIIGGVTRLRRIIAEVYGVDVIQAQPNFGGNGCIDTFLSYIQWLELTDSRRKGLLVATPTYFRYYHKAEALRMRLIDIPLGANYEYPLDHILTALKIETPSCFFLVTPNNPTGLPIPDAQLFEILDNVPEDLNVAIDRSCANIDPEVSTKNILKRYPHQRIAVIHSFSKYYGMSHFRIGFTVFSNRDLATEVDRFLPFGLNLEAMLRATYILTTEREVRPTKKISNFIRESRSIMKAFLERNEGFTCTDFKSNYAILTLPKQLSSRNVHRRLLDKGIFVMPGHELPIPDESSLRIHTGGPPLFLNRMLEVIEAWKSSSWYKAAGSSC